MTPDFRENAMQSLSDPTRATIWSLIGKVGLDEVTRHVPIDCSPFTIGRAANQHFSLPTPTVSSTHAEIRLDAGRIVLRDLGSTNGTFVNGVRITEECELNEGDLVLFASEVFRVERKGESHHNKTAMEDSADHALSLILFERMITERAVTPHIQPIVTMDGGAVVGYEVLGRSRMYGLKMPKAMFDAAEVLHLESELSRLLREEGIRQGERLPADAPLFLNTHPKEIQDIDLLLFSLDEIREIAPTRPIVLEIHEKAVTSADQMSRLHARLGDLGVGMAYDDFGAGQARLLELADVPPSYLKFDIELIRGIDTAPKERSRLVEQLVVMAHEFGVETIAEGVETAAEHRACADLGFVLGQGYYYGMPKAPSAYLDKP